MNARILIKAKAKNIEQSNIQITLSHNPKVQLHSKLIDFGFSKTSLKNDKVWNAKLKDLTEKRLAVWSYYLNRFGYELNDAIGQLGGVYIPASDKGMLLQTLIPNSMDFETHVAIRKIKNRIGGNIAKYVKEKLHYNNFEEMEKGLGAEQIDAVALAVYNIEEKGQSLIIGDQTGIGKGRSAAGVIRYAILNGRVPIFITEKPTLFSDIFRDLKDIGFDNSLPRFLQSDGVEQKVKYKSWDKLSAEEKEDYEDEEAYEQYIIDNPTTIVSRSTINTNYHTNVGTRVVPFIVNSRSNKTKIKDTDGNIYYDAEPNESLQKKKILENCNDIRLFKNEYHDDYNCIFATYSQFSSSKMKDKIEFLRRNSPNNIIILDETHKASGSISNTGQVFQSVVSSAFGVLFLSATFAKRPDNFPLFASKTCMSESQLTQQGFIDALANGGTALQEIISAQLVSEGQMLRRERSNEGVETNTILLTEKEAEHRAISDKFTEIFRDIINFQNVYVFPYLKGIEDDMIDGGDISKTKGTEDVGVNATPMFSRVFNIINQFLFSVKADAVAELAIKHIREGKKPVIAFSSTMGAFIDEIGEVGKFVDGDFSQVLEKALYTSLKYTENSGFGKSKTKIARLEMMSQDAQKEYARITEKIKKSTIGIGISPIDYIINKIEKAGYKVGEVTGRKIGINFGEAERYVKENGELPMVTKKEAKIELEEQDYSDLPEKQISKKDIPAILFKIMPKRQMQAVLESSNEMIPVLNDLAKQCESAKHRQDVDDTDDAIAKLHFFYRGSDWYILDWDNRSDEMFGYAILNGDMQSAEYGYLSIDEFSSNNIELDFYWTPIPMRKVIEEKLNGIGYSDTNKVDSKFIGMVYNLNKKLTATDLFNKFNRNELDCLLINQSGSTGASAHAKPYPPKVLPKDVKKRVMILIQFELDINTEMQKRGRIHRTGQIMTPQYDAVCSEIPAEKRLQMMMLAKLKSLDANTTSNQKANQNNISSAIDFMNKYGDKCVREYMEENRDFHIALGRPLSEKGNRSDPSTAMDDELKEEGAVRKCSGRVAILSCKMQEEFYNEITEKYLSLERKLKDAGDWDLEVNEVNLEADTIATEVYKAGTGGSSLFGKDTIIETCEVNNLYKPYNADQVSDILAKYVTSHNGKTAREITTFYKENCKSFIQEKQSEEMNRLSEREKKYIEEIVEEGKYKKLLKLEDKGALEDGEESSGDYIKRRTVEIQTEMRIAKDKIKTAHDDLYFTINQQLSRFMVGNTYSYPADFLGGRYMKAVFLGVNIDLKAKNPFTRSKVNFKFAICSSKRSVELNLTPADLGILKQIGTDYNVNDNWFTKEAWEKESKSHQLDRITRKILTGNILQAFNDVRGQLISYTTIDGSIKKGILLKSDEATNVKEEEKGYVNVPFRKMKDAQYLHNLENGGWALLSNDLRFRKSNDWYFEFHCNKNKKHAPYYTDEKLIKLEENNNFNLSGNKMIGKFRFEDIKDFIDIMDDMRVSVMIPKTMYESYFQSSSADTITTKSEEEARAEYEFQEDKDSYPERLKKQEDKVKESSKQIPASSQKHKLRLIEMEIDIEIEMLEYENV